MACKERPQLQCQSNDDADLHVLYRFRWAYCQLQELKSLDSYKPKYVKQVLQTLPPTLDDTYTRMLTRIKKMYRQEALTLLRWLAYARSPPTLGELVDAVITDPVEESFIDTGERGGLRDALNILAGLVTIEEHQVADAENNSDTGFTTNDLSNANPDWGAAMPHSRNLTPGTRVRLAHSSLKEYLESKRILGSMAGQFHLESTIGHQVLAQSCLTYLRHYSISDEKMSTQQDLETFPLLKYAAESWFHHSALQHGAEDGREVPLLQLEGARKDWLSVHKPDMPWERPFGEGERTSLGSAIYYASFLGLVNAVESLLASGADVNAQGGRYGNALQAASVGGYMKIVQLLLDKGADVNAHGGEYGNALQAALKGGHANIVQLLVHNGADVNAQGGNYGSALLAAIEAGDMTVVQLLLDKGADVNTHGGEYDNALYAASERGQAEIVQLLLDRGADVDARGGEYGNALQAASVGGEMEVGFPLPDGGVNDNDYGEYRRDNLQAANYEGHLLVMKLLLSSGADVNSRCGHYGNALQAASAHGRVMAVRLLLEAGAEINTSGGCYSNALHAASSQNFSDVMLLLLEHGADTEARSESFETPLQAACVTGSAKIVKLLLDFGADPNAAPGSYGTSLRAAALSGSEGITSQLLVHGADPNAHMSHEEALSTSSQADSELSLVPRHSSSSALRTARREGHQGVVGLLLRAGAADHTETLGQNEQPETSMATNYEFSENRTHIYASDDGSGAETEAESVFSRRQISVMSEPTTASAVSRNMRKLTNPLSMVGVAAAPGHVSFSRHPLHETTLVARHSWNFDTILCTGSSSDLCEILERHFDDIATGDWLWLTELADLGYDRKDIAEFIVEQREQSPWIYFQPWITSFDMPDPRFHIQRCVHAILESSYGPDFNSSADQTSSDRSSTCDLRRAIASLCGVGGVVPDSPEKRDWIGRLEFLSLNRATICYRYDDINPSQELARVGRAVARLSTAIAMTQKAKGCCNTFTILCNNSGRSCIELCTISVRDIIHFYNTLQAASIADAQSLQRCKLAAMTALSFLHPSEEILASVENVSDLVETCLHISALAAQTLCSSFALYSQAHCSPFTPFFLQEDLEEVNLLGVLRNPSEGIYVRAETKRLTCLDAMLNAPVVVYSMSTDAAITKNRLDVLARASDLVDTWGPGAIQGKTENRQAETITSIDLRGGKIHATGPNRLHWTPFEDLHNAWCVSYWDASDKVVVGALIQHNLSCPITERKCVETIQGCCLPLGTQASYWDQRHREAALQGGQFVTPMFNVGWDKVPGVSLKVKYLEDLRCRREQIAFLNAPCGLQVSFCSGLARRVSMKDLLAELLPLYVNRGLSGSHSWKTLTDVYNILGTLKARDAADCQAMFQRMSAEDNGCFEWFWNQACYIVTSLRSTGLDPTGNTFAVGLISSDASEPMRHVPFKTEASNFWLKALRDTESCATFAFFTLDCFQVDGHGCRRTEQRWHGRVLLSQTEVHQQRNGAPTRNAGDKMILQDGKVYPLGGRDIERSIRLCVKVIRPSPSVDPQLLVQRSIIAPSTWKRILMRHDHFLQERLGPNDDASRAFMTGSHATPFSLN
jgi:ankyrin repeat protein